MQKLSILKPYLLALIFYILLQHLLFPFALDGRAILGPDDGLGVILPKFLAPIQIWSEQVFAGYPIAAEPQSITWYPLAFLAQWIFGPFHFFNYFILSAYILGAFFTFIYLYTTTRSFVGSLTGGTIFCLSGFMTGHLNHINIMHSAIWFPVILLAIEKCRIALQTNSQFGGWTVLGGLAFALCLLSGHPQIYAYTIYCTMFYTLYRAYYPQKSWNTKLLFCFGVMVLLGLGLAAIQVVPTFELQNFTPRSADKLSIFTSWSSKPYEILYLFYPILFFFSWFYWFGEYYCVRYMGATSDVEGVFYVGILPILFFFLARKIQNKETRSMSLFWVGAGITALLLCLGHYGPLAELFFNLPFYGKFRVISRHLFVFMFAASLVSGFVVAALAKGEIAFKTHRRSLLIFIASSLLILTAIYIFKEPFREYMQAKSREGQIEAKWFKVAIQYQFTILVAVFLLALGSIVRPFHPKARIAFLFLALFLDILHYRGVGYATWNAAKLSKTDFQELVLKPQKITQELTQDLRKNFERIVQYDGTNNFALRPNLTRAWKVPSIGGQSALILNDYSTFTRVASSSTIDLMSFTPENRSLDMLAVKYAVFMNRKYLPKNEFLEEMKKTLDPKKWEFKNTYTQDYYRKQEFYVFENKNRLPRAWFVDKVIKASRDDIIQAVRSSKFKDGVTFDPMRTALVEEEISIPSPSSSSRSNERVQILSLEDTKIQIQTLSEGEKFLVSSEIFYPGWKAKIDGQEVPVYRTDYTLRGIQVPAGSHQITFEYKPKSYLIGITLTVLSTLLAIFFWVFPFYFERFFKFTNSLIGRSFFKS